MTTTTRDAPDTGAGGRKPAMIQVRGLVKRYGDFTAVNSIDLEVINDEIFGILGPNGAGKTTTLEMIEGLRDPDAGTIEVAGIDAISNPNEVKHIIGVQLQTTSLFDHLTVRELISLFAALYDSDTSSERIDELLGLVSLEEKADSRANQLSGGQQQRLSIALALVNDPEIVFLDEPTTGLDPQARRNLWDVISGLRSAGKTIVLTTHYMEEAEVLCDRVAIMDAGRIIACDTPLNLIQSLDQDATIRARVDRDLDLDAIRRLPGAIGAEIVEGQLAVRTTDVQATLTGLLGRATDLDIRLDNLMTTNANLEDVFLELTGRSLRE
ncbi:MAG: ABC transporter ATP-binding protein [Thermomicrobiales bacterium]